jgi:hypothetical protein
LVIVQMFLLVSQPLMLWARSMRIKNLLNTQVRCLTLAEFTSDSGQSLPSVEQVRQWRDSLIHGCFAPLERQPAIGALVAVVGSSSLLCCCNSFSSWALRGKRGRVYSFSGRATACAPSHLRFCKGPHRSFRFTRSGVDGLR